MGQAVRVMIERAPWVAVLILVTAAALEVATGATVIAGLVVVHCTAVVANVVGCQRARRARRAAAAECAEAAALAEAACAQVGMLAGSVAQLAHERENEACARAFTEVAITWMEPTPSSARSARP